MVIIRIVIIERVIIKTLVRYQTQINSGTYLKKNEKNIITVLVKNYIITDLVKITMVQ